MLWDRVYPGRNFGSATTNRIKPVRRVSDDPEEFTDGDGRLILRNVGIQVTLSS